MSTHQLHSFQSGRQPRGASLYRSFLMMKRSGHLGGMTVMPERPTLLPMATWVRCGTDDPKGDAPLRAWEDLSAEGVIGGPAALWNPPRWRVP